MASELNEAETTRAVITAFYAVYDELGYGFLESLYMTALERELLAEGHAVGREVYVPVSYRGAELGRQRLDMIVDEKVVVEAKATETLHPIATRQLFAYLRATRLEVGLLLHFGPRPRFRRVVCLNDPQPGVPTIDAI
jgi:GxxExxY protein